MQGDQTSRGRRGRRVTSLALMISLLLVLSLHGAETQMGTTFVVGFIENRIVNALPVGRLYLSSHSASPVTVAIIVPKIYMSSLYMDLMSDGASERPFRDVTLIIQPGSLVMHEFPYEIHMLGTGIESKGIYISASADIAVQAASITDFSADAYTALPIYALGNEYFAMSYVYKGSSAIHQGPSELGMVGVYDRTNIMIILPSDDFVVSFPGYDVRRKGRHLSLTLDRFETYQLQSNNDLTGTRVVSSKPLSVLSGAKWTSIGAEYMGDHLLEQLPPVSLWGKQYVATAVGTRSAGDVFRVLGSRNSTLVRITVTPRGKIKSLRLDAGGYHEFEISSRESVIVTSTKPVLLAQLCKSFNADDTRNSDPFMMLATPTTQLSNYYVYSTPGLIRYEHYANVFIDFSNVEGIRLDGRALRDSDFLSSWRRAGREYAVAKLKMAAGVHVLTHVNHVRFGAVAYGLKRQESYGFPLGMYARDYREDFPKLTTEQERVTAPEEFTRTAAWTMQEVTSAQSTEGTTVGFIPTTEAARTVGYVHITATSVSKETPVADDVVATTEIPDVHFTGDQDGMFNETLLRNNFDGSSNVETDATSTALTEWNTTMDYSVTPQLLNSTVAPPKNVPNVTLRVASANTTEATEIATIEATHGVMSEHRHISVLSNITGSPTLAPATFVNYTAWFDDSNITKLFLENVTSSASNLTEKPTIKTNTVGPEIATTKTITQDNDTSIPNSFVNTVAHSRTTMLIGNTTEAVKVTFSNSKRTFNDTTATTNVQVEGNGSVRWTTEVTLSKDNLTHGTVTDALITTAAVIKPTAVETSTEKSDYLIEMTTLERNNTELANTTTTVHEETATSTKSNDYLNTNESGVLPATTQSSLDMLNSTQSSAESTVNVTSGSQTPPGVLSVMQSLPTNHSATTTFETNVSDDQQHSTIYSISTLSPPYATERANIPTSPPPTNQTENMISLDPVENTAFQQPLENKTTTPEISVTVDVIWSNETQTNVTIPTASLETYNNATELYVLFLDDRNSTLIANKRANETIWREDNVPVTPTVAPATETPTKQTTTELPSGAELIITPTVNITNGTTETVRVNTASISPTVVTDFVNLIPRKNVSVYTDTLNNASLLGNISSLESTQSTFTEVTSINPIDNGTSLFNITTTHTVNTSDVTASNVSFIMEYVGQMNRSSPERTEYVESQSNETTSVLYDLNTDADNSTASLTTTYRDINYTLIATINDTIWTSDPVPVTDETTVASTVQITIERKTTESNDSETTAIGTQSIVTNTNEKSLLEQSDQTWEPSPETTVVGESTVAETTFAVAMTEPTTLDSNSYIKLSTTNSLAETDVDKPLPHNVVQQPEHDIDSSTANDTVNRQNYNNQTATTQTSEITPNSEKVSATKGGIGLTATILVATLFGVPMVLLCGCFCYGVCCGVCRKRGRGACCRCAKRRRRNIRVRPMSQWSSSSQRSDASSRRSSLVYIDPSVLESRGLVAPPAKKNKLDFLNFYQKPSCSSWVEVVDEQAGDMNRRLDYDSASRVKDLHGKMKGKGKRSMSAYGRNRKVGPTSDTRPPLPRKDMTSRMQAYIVKH